MIGHELGGRYEIIERIGGGGMALVYKAHDLLLGRNVAVKVLRQQFVHDEEFIRRFRREAQSAASLSHPNVVSIYDVGQEDEVHYIVMEYVEGHNLNEIIKERAPLQVDEAVRIASQICDALDHAHQNQIIHRDIKPHNILIGRNGRVKVTDFGIARAVTSTTITQTGSVVGSVHYFSPEHAKGVVTGEKSDLYSLGIVLYQMLTAQLPFLGESPISVALKHLQEEFEEPRKMNPLIPQSVENIILKSMRKNPQERYQSAKEMLHDLDTCLLPERRNERKMDFMDLDDEDRTRVIPAIKPQQIGAVPVRSRPAAPTAEEEERHERPAAPAPAKPRKNGRAALWISLTLVILLAMGGLAWYVNHSLTVPDVKVPNLVGKTEDQARQELTGLGLVVDPNVIRKYKEGVTAGYVFAQSKEEGAEVKKGASIQLSVGMDKELKKMPDVKDSSYEDAVKALVSFGFKEDNINQDDPKFSDKPVNTVIAQKPGANEEVDPDKDQVTLTVSKGLAQVKMPSLIDLTQDKAVQKLKANGFTADPVIEQEASYTVDKGKVIKQFPYDPGMEADPASKITITVSSGYPQDSLKYTLSLPVAPAVEGQSSKISVEYSDARTSGENKAWGNRTIKTTQVLSVDLVLSPNVNGIVTVKRDGQVFDTYSVTYEDAKNGTVPPITLPDNGGGDQGAPDDNGDRNQDNNGDTTGMNFPGNGNGHGNPGKGKGKNKDTEAVIYKKDH
ncbi:Stk1 family PASTA domain-containing Ser/Thr kinase [Paenibacillus chibensis]|uniref:Stk1 family PASTA domain-containing Ser/Thr kinase n=1 Tax=Paenibacillus chibensis TaxID=59846 RepID=UPI000FD81A68|nr:Stk1 family PASTA domain-containing Ser/Thr kinase [Paenibacillus chibensis]MEC0371890.1 Stk1 family PASTA domain-containing Ser/Thr kinase [Paenibacillus chibensis]